MSRDKQIEEMAKILCDNYSMGECMVDTFDCLEGHCEKRERIEALYNAGYRKTSEVAREVFEEVHESIKAERFHHNNFGYLVYLEDIDRILAELKKKYTESEKT